MDCFRRAALGLSIFLLGCSSKMDIQLIRYPEAAGLADRGDDCEMRLVDATAPLEGECRDVGDVFVGDTGFSVSCDEERVMGEIRTAACRLGADTAVVRRLGGMSSTCYQARARLLSCSIAGDRGES
jgi:hypothetical protein